MNIQIERTIKQMVGDDSYTGFVDEATVEISWNFSQPDSSGFVKVTSEHTALLAREQPPDLCSLIIACFKIAEGEPLRLNRQGVGIGRPQWTRRNEGKVQFEHQHQFEFHPDDDQCAIYVGLQERTSLLSTVPSPDEFLFGRVYNLNELLASEGQQT